MPQDFIKKLHTKVSQLLQAQEQTSTRSRNSQTRLAQALSKMSLASLTRQMEEEKTLQLHPYQLLWNYLENSLAQIQQDLQQLPIQSVSSPVRIYMRALQSQLELYQKLFGEAKKQDSLAFISQLVQAYPKQTPQMKKLTVSLLHQAGPEVVLALLDSLNEGKEQHELFDLLGKIGSIAAPALLLALYHDNTSVRLQAVQSLSEMQLPESIPALLDATDDPEFPIRKIAIEALGKMAVAEATEKIIEKLDDKSVDVRIVAVRALGQIQSKQALNALLKKLEDNNWEVRREVVEAMAEYGPGASGYLAKALENDSLVVKKIASRILADIGNEEAVPALMRAIYDKDISVRERAVIALGRIQGENSLVSLMFAFDDKAPLVRFAAIQVLVNVGSAASIHLLHKAKKDSEPLIRKRAEQAIQTIQQREKHKLTGKS